MKTIFAKTLLLILSVLLLLSCFTFPVSAGEKSDVIQTLDVVYFYSSKCLACKENKSFIANLERLDGINLITYNTDAEDCSGAQYAYAEYYGVPEEQSLIVPFMYFGNKYYELSPSNHQQVLNDIDAYVSGAVDFENFNYDPNKCEQSVFEKFMKDMTVPGILLAGLLDGINPCAISMLMVFYSFLLMTENKKKIILMSSMFIFGIFMANLSFGLGIKTFYNYFAGNAIIMYVLYGIAIAMCFTAIVLNTIDIINKDKNIEAKNQLPDRIKFKLANILRNSVFSKFAIFIILFVGFLIGVVELACTGQIYFPTLTYMIQNTQYGFKGIILLIAYNIMFVLPLIIITVAAGCFKEPEKIKNIIMKKNWIIKLCANIFFVIMLIVLLKQIVQF